MTDSELKKHIETAASSPKEIAAAVAGLPDATLRYKPAPNKWSILEMLAHLVDMETLYAYRMRQMLADKDPQIAPIDQDEWARNLGYTEESVPELLALYGLNRHHNLQLLRRLKPADLDKGAFHPEHKRKITVAEIIGMMAKHGPNHLEQIERLKREAKK